MGRGHESNSSITEAAAIVRIRALWSGLIEPYATIEDDEVRRRARLLALIATIYMPVHLIIPLVAGIFDRTYDPFDDPIALVWWGNGFALLLSFALSRTKHYRLGFVMVFLALSATSATIATARASIELFLPWLLAPVLLGSLLLPLKAAVGIATIALASGLVLLSSQPRIESGQQLLLFGFLVGASFFSTALALIRYQSTMRLRGERRDLDVTKEELRQVRDDLEKMQVGQQTEELLQAIGSLREQIAERMRTEEELERRNRALGLLNRVIVATTSTLEIEAGLEIACRELAQAFTVPYASAFLVNGDGTAVTFVAEYRKEGQVSPLEALFRNDNNVMVQLLKQKRPVVIDASEDDPMLAAPRELKSAIGMGSMLLLPLYVRDVATGGISLLSSQARSFAKEDLELAGNVAAAVSQMLYDAQLFAAEREQRALAEALRDTAAVISSSLNLEEVLDRILTNVGHVVTHDSANIMLVEGDYGQVVRLRGYAERGEASQLESRRLIIGEVPLLKRMSETQQPVCVPDTRDSVEWVSYPDVDWIQSYVGAPICIEESLIGFIHLNSDTVDHFSDAHARNLLAFANQAAVTIHNARLHEQVERHAVELEQRVKERTAELEAANTDLERLARVKDEFVSNISHELRTPITNLLLRHDLIVRRPERFERHLAVIRRETKRLHRIIEDLLQLSRLDRGQITSRAGSVDINSLVERFVADRAALADERGMNLSLETRPNLPTVETDEELMGQVLGILLTNAISYSPKGARIWVTTDIAERDGQAGITFAVRDSGPGIAADEQAEVFGRFFRGSAAMESGVPGTGLGLAIASEIVKRHHGQIELFSQGEEGKGSTFTVWLPSESL
jgi:signal transduction histidine kinase